MTDSGSFDSGDLIYAADIGNLTTLINAKCAEAGVTASPYVAANFVVGNPIDAASHNDLIAAYQRAWDASSNKPGTRQSAVSQGGTIYGALYQNMWTQLNQMTFTGWADWDESSEASLQSASTFVALMENPTTGGNEVGQGLGLSEADRTLTSGTGVVGASGGKRQFPNTNSYLVPTTGLLQASVQRNGQWTYIMKAEGNWRFANAFPLYIADASASFLLQTEPSGASASRLRMLIKNTAGSTIADIVTANLVPTSGVVYFYAQWNGSALRVGFSTSKVSAWASIAAGNQASASVGSGAYCYGSATSKRTPYNGADGGIYIYYVIFANTALLT